MLPVFKNYRKIPINPTLANPISIPILENSIISFEFSRFNGTDIEAYYEVPTGTGANAKIHILHPADNTTSGILGGSTKTIYNSVALGLVPKGRTLEIRAGLFGNADGVLHIFELPDEVL
jgi:hypothetical protein